jgi:5-formyltetrahydrofolate cyclo-ligase
MLSYDSKIEKADLREAVLQRRDGLAAPARAEAAEAIASRPLPVPVRPGMVVSGFSPIRSEINPVPLLRRFAGAGASLALPAIVRRGEPLVFRAFHFGQELARGQWGIREPSPDAPEVRPDIVLAPLAVFDRRGNRIGYGAGYYDRTLRALRAIKPVVVIGLAFALQEAEEIPARSWDEPLDFVLTEREVIDCRRA